MDKQSLRNYFKLCKTYDSGNFQNIIKNIENKNIGSEYPDLNRNDLETISNLKKTLGGGKQGNDELLKLYNYYHLKGGQGTLSKIGSFLKKSFTPEKIKSTLSTFTTGAKKIIEASAPVIADAVIKNPDIVISIVHMAYDNLITPIINSSFKDASKKKKVTDAFNIALVAFDSGITSASQAKEALDVAKTDAGSNDSKQTGGQNTNNNEYYDYSQSISYNTNYDNDDENMYQYDNYNYTNELTELQGGQNNDNDYENYQYGGTKKQYDSYYDQYSQYGGKKNKSYNKNQYKENNNSEDYDNNQTFNMEDQIGGNFSDTSDDENYFSNF